MKMNKDATLEWSSQQVNKDLINRRNGQGPKHLKFFLLVFSKDDAQAQEAQAQETQAQSMRSKAKALGDEHHWMSLFVISFWYL